MRQGSKQRGRKRDARGWRTVRRTIGWIVGLLVAAMLAFMAWAWAKGRPQDLPWTPLDLGAPVGMFTGRKLVGLTENFPQCRALLDRAGVRYTVLPPRRDSETCGYDDAVRFTAGGARRIGLAPANLGIACPVAAAMAMWEWNVVQPAAMRHFGTRVAEIEHFGSYNCRRIAGRDARNWSQHATADAIDIAAFRLGDGMRISVVGDWTGGTGEKAREKAAFLREVRDGACDLFATTLSPDYNAAHRDHFHLDQANRGAMGWRACR